MGIAETTACPRKPHVALLLSADAPSPGLHCVVHMWQNMGRLCQHGSASCQAKLADCMLVECPQVVLVSSSEATFSFIPAVLSSVLLPCPCSEAWQGLGPAMQSVECDLMAGCCEIVLQRYMREHKQLAIKGCT